MKEPGRFDIEETASGWSGSYRDMVPELEGDWIRYEDYVPVAAENDRLRAELETATEVNHSVAVCRNHTDEVTIPDALENGCLVCDNDKLRDGFALANEENDRLRALIVEYAEASRAETGDRVTDWNRFADAESALLAAAAEVKP